MEFETKILSKSIQEMLYNSDKTVGTAESCTGGRIAEALISVPGASNYFKGGVVSYTNEVKENLLGVSHELLEEKTAFCEEVAKEIDQEVHDIIDKCHQDAREIITQHMDVLHKCAALLLEKEKVHREEIEALFTSEKVDLSK